MKIYYFIIFTVINQTYKSQYQLGRLYWFRIFELID
jgi:hypothetical protein